MKRAKLGGLVAATMMVAVPAMAEDFKLSVVTPAKQAWSVESQAFADAVAEASGGAHSVEVFHSAQLGTEPEVIRQMQSGTVDFALLTVSELANRIPEFNLLLAPGLVESNEHAARFLNEGLTPAEMLGLLEQRIGIKGLAYGMAGVTQVMANFDAESPADLAGKKIRITPSPAILEFDKIIGAAPVPIPLPGLYDAFANGQVDAMETNLDIMRVLKVADHAETLLISNQGMFPAVVAVSMRTWQGLSDEDRALFTKLAQDYGQSVISATLEVEEISRQHFANLAENGLKVVEVDRVNYADLWTEWDDSFGAGVGDIAGLRAEADALNPE